MPRPRCSSCYYLGHQQVDRDSYETVCRRNSPMPIAEEEVSVSSHTFWPLVHAEIDWCGDHFPRGEDEP